MIKNWRTKIPKFTKPRIAILCVLLIIAIILEPELIGLLIFLGYPITLIIILFSGNQRWMTWFALLSCGIFILGSILTYQYVFAIVVWFYPLILLATLIDSVRFHKKSWHRDRIMRVCGYLLSVLVFWGCSEYVSQQRKIIQNEIMQVVDKYRLENNEYPSEEWLQKRLTDAPINISFQNDNKGQDDEYYYLSYCRQDLVKTGFCIRYRYDSRGKRWYFHP